MWLQRRLRRGRDRRPAHDTDAGIGAAVFARLVTDVHQPSVRERAAVVNFAVGLGFAAVDGIAERRAVGGVELVFRKGEVGKEGILVCIVFLLPFPSVPGPELVQAMRIRSET